ncbi:MAG: hypothetical protein OEM52_12970, partial [bacterium]|nr:hypothetical protein [bacterium]
LDNGESDTDFYYLASGTSYYIYQHGDQNGTTHVKVVSQNQQLIWQADMVYNQTKFFSVSTSGWYYCSTENTTTGANQHLHSDWQH